MFALQTVHCVHCAIVTSSKRSPVWGTFSKKHSAHASSKWVGKNSCVLLFIHFKVIFFTYLTQKIRKIQHLRLFAKLSPVLSIVWEDSYRQLLGQLTMTPFSRLLPIFKNKMYIKYKFQWKIRQDFGFFFKSKGVHIILSAPRNW